MPDHLYLHIPFCHRICPYCAFYKHQHGNTNLVEFVDALLREVDRAQADGPFRPRTVYFGGGTPTALSETHLDRLLTGLRDRLDASRLSEFSMEANPRTVTASKARLLHSFGINRISLGVQAWDPGTLATLGRDHSPAEARETFDALREAGFDNINIDLMFSIPGQSLQAWEESLLQTVALQPGHVSAYNLNYEEDTAFFQRLQRGQYREDQDRDAEFFYLGLDVLEAAGFEHYEISNYARQGRRSAHNESYWRGADYRGFGPGAFSTWNGRRWQNIADTARYMTLAMADEDPALPPELLTPDQQRTERFGLELRTQAGIDAALVKPAASKMMEALWQEGLIAVEDQRIRLTRAGKPLVDSIAVALMAED